LNGAQARLAVCTCTNVMWSARRRLGTPIGVANRAPGVNAIE
jgi:hypothetical protein